MIQDTSPRESDKFNPVSAEPQNDSAPQSQEQPDQILTRSRVLVPPRPEQLFAATVQPPAVAAVDWQTAMRKAIRSGKQLLERLQLPADTFPEHLETFPTFVPLEFLSRMAIGDPADPLLRQVLPVSDELVTAPNFVSDPVGDLDSLAAGGVIHKYDGRVLLIASGVCAVHCRYCFRREFPYQQAGSRRENWAPAIQYIQAHPDVEEVILSGGDPLTLTDAKLFELIERIDAIPHVRRIRLHTRLPIVIPQRVTDSLCSKLKKTRSAVWFVVHCNHANELDSSVIARMEMLVDSGIPVLNQAVLLRGVNDDEQTLVDLCMKLVNHRIQPYYLHQLDRVRGTKHFEVPVQQGLELIHRIRSRLPGYAVPTYVREQAGEPSKTPL
ncbi:lysine 2,3-aminomutase YodO family protein [Rhodopirellula maiorica SM1]|uniref:L-lysine 2,3-aminomutase n=1 Tax=Rhodopirellula maiorica SM1 TaxID=1265738 RepID=M5RUU1_9BACT|nr:EF-P beta-lysylation protein EpmB [Rhodopirellula maiorica]EMI19162.1 lysine 2,3-aminomutase YodO family protein [Rhodopirellula maiorica SM1]